MLSRRLKQRFGSTALIALTALLCGTASANAGVLVSSAPDCAHQALSTPFISPWLDPASYTPLSGGDFESAAAGWALSGGAAVAAGSESFHVAGPGASSLTVPSDGSATSPTICVGLEHPTIRFFAKRNTGGLLGLSVMRVDVLFQSTLGLVSSLPIGVVTPSSSWQPTLPMTILVSLLPVLDNGQKTPVAFRFTPLLGGSWSIDDIYVDPYNRH